MSFFDRLGAGTCSGGETIRPALEIADKDGNLVDLTGRVFVYWITAAGAKLHECEAAVAGTRAVASIPGTKTRELAGRVGLEHWWIEQVADGFRQWNRASLTVRSAGPEVTGLATPDEDVVLVTDRGVLRIVANGAPGVSVWVAMGQTLEEYDASLRAPALEGRELIDDAITELGETASQTFLELDAIAEAADAAGDYARDQADLLQQANGRIAELEGDLAVTNEALAEAASFIDIFAALYPISLVTLNGQPLTLNGNPISLGAQ